MRDVGGGGTRPLPLRPPYSLLFVGFTGRLRPLHLLSLLFTALDQPFALSVSGAAGAFEVAAFLALVVFCVGGKFCALGAGGWAGRSRGEVDSFFDEPAGLFRVGRLWLWGVVGVVLLSVTVLGILRGEAGVESQGSLLCSLVSSAPSSCGGFFGGGLGGCGGGAPVLVLASGFALTFTRGAV